MKTIAIFIATLVFFYLIGAFVSVSFNIKDWTPDCRFFTMLLGVLVSGLVTGYYLILKSEQ